LGYHDLAAKKVFAATVIDGANKVSFGSNCGVHANLLGWDSPHLIVPHKSEAPYWGFLFASLAVTASFAISRRRFLERVFARALPPREPRETAAGFLVFIEPLSDYFERVLIDDATALVANVAVGSPFFSGWFHLFT
jgi:hypothetical protein